MLMVVALFAYGMEAGDEVGFGKKAFFLLRQRVNSMPS
jgi:hypothetical protein